MLIALLAGIEVRALVSFSSRLCFRGVFFKPVISCVLCPICCAREGGLIQKQSKQAIQEAPSLFCRSDVPGLANDQAFLFCAAQFILDGS